ncbi:MAG: hypothetical protein IKF39_04210 [Oscillospiraceae bacterium]|nr:hypothetical protein [Oscillospiraceae bacterium]
MENRVYDALLAAETAKLDTDQDKKNLRACYELLIEVVPEHDRDEIMQLMAEKWGMPIKYVKKIVQK